MADTIRTTADLQTLLSDSAAAHSTNRQLLRDIVKSFDVTRRAVVNVCDAPYNATGNGTTDDTAAITGAIAAASATVGGVVYLPPGIYKTTAPIVVPRWVRLAGTNPSIVAGGTTYNGVAVIYGVHTGVAILDLRGTQGGSLKDITLYGDAVTTPKTGLLLGRTSAASAGCHVFDNLSVQGYFSKAAIYSIASEENKYLAPHIDLNGGGAKYCFYTSQGDDLAIGGLTGSSNIQGAFYSPEFINRVNDATASVIYISAGASTFAWNFFGGYLMPTAGAYVSIMTGAVDGADTPGQFTFLGVSGEKVPGGLEPITGFDLLVSGARTLYGLQVLGSSFELNNAAGRMVRQAATLTLKGCDIRSRARGGIGSSLFSALIYNSRFNDGFADVQSFYGDTQFAGKVFGSGDNDKGFFFDPAGPRFRLQTAVSQIQATDNAGASFYDLAAKDFYVGGASPIKTGVGTPEGVVAAPVGGLFLRTDGGATTTLYVKTSGVGNTGWTAK